jgi:MoaA/NifB/PqqE/SkfB family radical SAM enzyme
MRDVTLLWALRSACNLGCTYCYFGTIEEHQDRPPAGAGTLSHLSRGDLAIADIEAFTGTLPGSSVKRIFIAGGEPLIWPRTLDVAAAIKAAGIQVVLCTNGIPLNRADITERIIGLGLDAVSVSLDSPDPSYNDHYRPTRNHRPGHADVIAGARKLLAARANRERPRVGLYMVVTRHNIQEVTDMGRLAADLGMDYFVPQPISLTPGHRLQAELGLDSDHVVAVGKELTRLYEARLDVGLPDRSYAASFVSTLGTEAPGFVADCFGGHTLFFIEPDGSVWECPSYLKIAATPPSQHRTIRGSDARLLFGQSYRNCPADCALFSRDCVNMWPLTGFDDFLPNREAS